MWRRGFLAKWSANDPAAVRTRRDWLWVAAGLVVLALTIIPARAATVSGLERRVFDALNHTIDLPFAAVWVVMQFGNVLAISVVGLLALRARRARLAVSIQAGGYLAYYGAKMVKHRIRRTRPALLWSDVHLRGAASHGSGFVAGHSAVTAFLAMMLLPYVGKRTKVALCVLAATVSLLRVYVGAHLPLDVIGGAAVGVAAGGVTRLVFGRPAVGVTSDPGQPASVERSSTHGTA